MPSNALAHNAAKASDPTAKMRKFTTSTLRNKVGRVIKYIKNNESVLLTTHKKPQAVLVPYQEYVAAFAPKPKSESSALEFLTAHYAELAESMNTPAARAGAKEAFEAGPDAFRGLRLTE